MLKAYYIKKIGQNKGAPRIWLEGTQTERAGFKPGQRYDVTVHDKTVVLQANPDGSRIVSGKRVGERDNPVIDLNSRELLAIFDGMAAVRVAVKEGQIHLLPLASEIKKQERYVRLRSKLEMGEPVTIGSLSHGGGVMSHAIHAGLTAAGVPSSLAFANEIRPELLEHAAIHNDAWREDTQILAAPMQELAFDDRGVASIPKVEILEMGLPCQGASKAGMAKRNLKHPEAHPEVGHLVVSALVILSKTNAAVVIMENVPHYANSASADILRNQLRDMGYATHERILNGKQWGALENRDRWCMVAVTEGIAFDFAQLQPPASKRQVLGDVLEDVPLDDPRWSTMTGLKEKEKRDLEAGKGFRMQVFDAEADHIGTITKGYAKVRSTDPKIAHPTNPDLLRQLTPAEHARIKQVPDLLVKGLSATVAHEILGQGVVYRPFHDVGHHVGNALNKFAGRPESRLSDRMSGEEVASEKTSLIDPTFANEVVATLKRVERNGQYTGEIVAVDGDVMIQATGRNEGVLHIGKNLNGSVRLGESVKVTYRDGIGEVSRKDNRQLGLAL